MTTQPTSPPPPAWPADIAFRPWRRRGVQFLLFAILLLAVFIAGRCTSSGTDGAPRPHDGAASAAATRWTCSMHPQIQLPEFGQCPLCFMDLIPVQSDAEDAAAPALALTERARVLARVETTPIERRPLTREIRMVGKIAPDETRITYISSYLAGRIDRLFVDYTGMMVRKGDHLAVIYSPELLVAQQEYLLARDRLQSLKSHAAGAGDAAMTAAEAIVQAARRKLELWGIPNDEIARLEKEGRASDHMRIDAPRSGWVLERQGYTGMYVETGTRLFTVADLSRLWVLLDAYESDVQFLRYGQSVEFGMESLAGETFSGTISFIDPILIESTRTVKVRVNVSNADLRLRPGMFVRATVSAELGEGGKIISNELAGRFICPMHPEIVKDGPATCDECGMDLVPAESIGYATKETPHQQPLAVPATAVLLTGERALVYVESKTGEDGARRYEGRVIQIGARAGDWYAVISGLEEGERVVTNGALQIDAAMQIQARPSMMQPPTASTHNHAAAADATSRPAIVSRYAADAPYHAVAAPVIDAYLQLTNALAADDEAKSQAALTTLREAADRAAASSVPLGLDPDGATAFVHVQRQIAEAAKLVGLPTIAQVRSRLPDINKPFEFYLLTFGHQRAEPLYRAYCPMAFQNSGAAWFQFDTTINNAYFGSQMLRCGEITGTITRDGTEQN